MNLAIEGGHAPSPKRAVNDHRSDGVNRMSCSVANWTIPAPLRKNGRVSRVLFASSQKRSSSLAAITLPVFRFPLKGATPSKAELELPRVTDCFRPPA